MCIAGYEHSWINYLNIKPPEGTPCDCGAIFYQTDTNVMMKVKMGWPKGKLHSKETKEKIGLANRGRKMSEEFRKNLSKIKKGQIPWNVGKKCSEETKKKMSEAGKRKIFSEEHCKNLSIARNSENARKKLAIARRKQVFPLKDTKIEVKLQNFLKLLGLEFFTHQYMHIEHGYQCDILIPSMNIILEADGNYWHNYPMGMDIDKVRTKELIEKGFKVLRLWESEIKEITLERFKNKLSFVA